MKNIRSIILTLAFLGFMGAEAQVTPGYLGKKFAVGYHYSGMLTLPLGFMDNERLSENLWTFNHFLDAEYVVAKEWSLVASFGYSGMQNRLLTNLTYEFDAAFNPNFNPNNQSAEYWNAFSPEEYSAAYFDMNTFYLDLGYKRHKEFAAPVGKHSGWKLRLAFSNNRSMDLVTSQGNSYTLPSFKRTDLGLVYEFGTTYILWDRMYVDLFGEFGLMLSGIGSAFQEDDFYFGPSAYEGTSAEALSIIEDDFKDSMAKRVFYQNLFNFGIKIGILP